MKPRQFTNGNIDTQLKMISSRKKTKQNQILFFYCELPQSSWNQEYRWTGGYPFVTV